MKNSILTALRLTLVTLVLCGLIYPLVATGLSQVLFPSQAHGSLVRNDKGQVVGSSLIGQTFSSAAYLQPRPSAAGERGYDGLASGGSNLGPTSQKLRDRVSQQVERLRQENPDANGPIPADLVTTSGSGLDPDLSPEAARWQAPRIAHARGIAPERVLGVIDGHVEGPELGILGEPRVNVLQVNLALDRQFGQPLAIGPRAGAAQP
jgi:K+-transporting ATPase ATPase C chain